MAGSPQAPDQSAMDALVALIGSGNWAPGQKLPSQRQLAIRLGVSRPTVREALVALETLGRVRIRPGRGIYLAGEATDQSLGEDCRIARADALQRPSRLVQMYQFRYVVEPAVAGLAAQNATAAQLEDLKYLASRMREALERRDGALLSRLNCTLHHQIVEAANNPFFTKSLAPSLSQLIENQQPGVSPVEEAVAEHEALVEALALHAPGAARRAMRRHIAAAAARANIALHLA
ncbi:GntR domain protein [Solidesulfovibrio fructosivorans JJ]]|uniref:GntR domain protein n=1 Tax=Solidesulfovibrio fructosivorans JJ] TaxID=596151 RepID=E1JTE5_SOLFR|nr:FCD domain-containing protein [Solidesulfovibrio fructosivorans]EFL52405.1 GntR domain protein [Solidesulfovibrio fructosivorans JJ]]